MDSATTCLRAEPKDTAGRRCRNTPNNKVGDTCVETLFCVRWRETQRIEGTVEAGSQRTSVRQRRAAFARKARKTTRKMSEKNVLPSKAAGLIWHLGTSWVFPKMSPSGGQSTTAIVNTANLEIPRAAIIKGKVRAAHLAAGQLVEELQRTPERTRARQERRDQRSSHEQDQSVKPSRSDGRHCDLSGATLQDSHTTGR